VGRIILRITDLPDGWTPISDSYTKDLGGVSYGIGYQYGQNNRSSVGISHKLTTYKNGEAAKSAFGDWQNQWFNPYWIPISNIQFAPKNPEDTYFYGCMSLQADNLPLTSC
jgi:hypothetical protein